MAGRPSKFKEDYHPQMAFKLALLGLTDTEISLALDIAESTLNEWKKDHPVFSESLTEGKQIADANVAHSLYKRANGLVTKEVVYEDIEERIDHGDGTWHYEPKTRVKTAFKEEAPNTAAAIFFLKNRDPKRWKDKQEIAHTIPDPQSFNIGGQELKF
jgi:hypothetical protein